MVLPIKYGGFLSILASSLATQQVPSIDMLLRHRQMRHVAALGVLANVETSKKGGSHGDFLGNVYKVGPPFDS